MFPIDFTPEALSKPSLSRTTASRFNSRLTSIPGFGSSGGAFGAVANKPAFGATGTTSLFGGGSTSAAPAFGGGGGFGSNTASTGFGTTNTGGGLFGAAKPATTGFGAPASTGFGQPAAPSAFGASTGFGAATPAATAECPGTASVQYNPITEKEGPTGSQQVKYVSICCMDAYKKWSPEELRLADYNAGRKHASGDRKSVV